MAKEKTIMLDLESIPRFAEFAKTHKLKFNVNFKNRLTFPDGGLFSSPSEKEAYEALSSLR